MIDRITQIQRSANMARIRSKNTSPELRVRRLLHSLGYRFRIHWKPAPGRPDVAFPGRKKMIQVHGCFWHQHAGCKNATFPKTRQEFWSEKLSQNVARDLRNQQAAEQMGWQVLVIWECETTDSPALAKTLMQFLGPKRKLPSS